MLIEGAHSSPAGNDTTVLLRPAIHIGATAIQWRNHKLTSTEQEC